MQCDCCPYKKRRDTDLDTERTHDKMGAEITVKHLQAKNNHRLLVHNQKPERLGEDAPSESQAVTNLEGIWVWTSSFQTVRK